MIKNKWNNSVPAVIGWIAVTVCISLLDFILVVLLAVDYDKLFKVSFNFDS